MNIYFRQITDIVSITALLTIGLYHLLSFFVRIRQETDKSDLFFALFVISLAGYVFFDNTLSLLLYKGEIAARVNTAGVTFCIFLMTIGFYYFLYTIFKIPARMNTVKYVSVSISFIAFLAGLSLWRYGYIWYITNIFKWLVIAYGIIFLTNTILIIVLPFKSRQLISASQILFFLTSHVLILSLFIFKILLLIDLRYFYFNNFIILLFCVLFFPILLVSKSSRELQELAALKEKLKNLDNKAGLEMQKLETFIPKRELNEKEKQVMFNLLKGLEYKEIAHNLNLSLSGVKKRVHSLYKKTDVQSRSELVNLVFGLEL